MNNVKKWPRIRMAQDVLFLKHTDAILPAPSDNESK
jgi:hypothetical protein